VVAATPVAAGADVGAMVCPNCGGRDPYPPVSDDGTTTCPRCGHRFPVNDRPAVAGPDERRTGAEAVSRG
jgi:uncharacterized Zn finger protein (UPF0148 family)